MSVGLIIVFTMGAIMLIIGFWTSKLVKTSDDYYVGGRNLGALVTISTQCATFVGGGMTLGWIGMGFRYGAASAWYGAPQALGFFFMAAVMVTAMRHSGSFTSLPDWFDNMYQHKGLSIISALVCLIVPVTWVTAQTTAAARMLETVGVPYLVGVLVIGGIVILYSTVGGYLAVVYTDTLQWLLLLAIFTCTVPFAIIEAGGLGNVIANTPAYMSQPMHVEGMPSYTIPLWIISGLVSGMGLQSSYQRIYSARTDKIAKQGLVITGVATIFFAILTSFVGRAVYSLGAPADLVNDKVWPWFLNNYMPSWIAVIYTVCIMMATMSTADSMLNSISLTITHDLYSKYINPKADDKKVLKVGIIVSGIFGVLALYWATAGSWMIALFGMSYTLGAGPLAGAVITAALLKKKANPKCIMAGLILGAVTGFITLKVPSLASVPAGGAVFSFAMSLLVCMAGSYIFKSKTNITEEIAAK
ncbi:MAG: sodium:solute symporter family protein [Clostridiaceae bacterium]|jgi:SSS family transporter|nr:sodium:solute symporter family protein [Clostridiaceae bacterium]